ncbi:MAG: HAMP domain-containing sensor histidine kinase [Ekhidna sp.]
MFKKLSTIYRLGFSDSLSTYDAFKLQIVNRLAVLCIGVALILILINLVFQNYTGILIDVGAAVLVGFPVLLFNKFERYQLAIYLFLLGFHIALITGTYHTIVEGRQNGVEYLFIPGVIAIILLVSGAGQYIGVLLNFVMLTILNYVRFEYYDTGDFSTYFRLTLILFAAYLMVYFFVVNFKNQLFRTLENTEKLNADLLDKEEALLDSNKSKDRLFSIIAHDLRAPLTSVQGLLQPDVIQSMSKEDYFKYAETAREKVDNLQDTMNGLLGWAKSQLDSLTVHPETVIIRDEIEKIGDLFSGAIAAKNIHWNYDADDSQVFADKNQLIIILRNIIHNAIKFSSKDGRIQVSAVSKGTEVCISVEDAGMGMDEEIRDRILKGQLNESAFGTAGESGSGIGLSFCYELLKKNDGRLEIENAIPTGTIFKVWLAGVSSR